MNADDIETVSDAVYATLADWFEETDPSPRNINSGECMVFANEVALQYPGDLIIKTTNDPDVLGPTENPEYDQEPYHAWVFDGQNHYDSETPEGVSSWRDLPFFQRAGYGEPGTY